LKKQADSTTAQLVEQDSRKIRNKEVEFNHRSDGLLLVILLQVSRAIMNIALFFISEVQYHNYPPWVLVSRVSNFPQFVLVFIDLSVALWCWTRRKEAWGIAMGIGVIQITLPFIWNPFLNAVILLITTSEILLLLSPNVRHEFVEKATLQRRGQSEQASTHHQVF